MKSDRSSRAMLLLASVTLGMMPALQPVAQAQRGGGGGAPASKIGAICETGTVAELQAALDAGASANAAPDVEEGLMNNRACGPLCRAAGPERLAKLDLLLARGADPNRPSCWGRTALDTAIFEDDETMVRKLLSASLKPNYVDLQEAVSPLIRAVQEKNVAIVRTLIEGGASVQLANGLNCSTPLHEAAALGDASLVDVLLANGASREAKDSLGRTPAAVLPSGSPLGDRLKADPSQSFDSDCQIPGSPTQAAMKAALGATRQPWCVLPKDREMTLFLDETARAKEALKWVPSSLTHLKARLYGEMAASFLSVKENCRPDDADFATLDDGLGRLCPQVFSPGSGITPKMQNVLKAHFAAIASGQPQIDTLIDRLYTATDIEPALLGYAKSQKANPYRSVSLPSAPPGAQWFVVSENGHDAIVGEHVILTQGRTRLAALKGQEVLSSLMVDVAHFGESIEIRPDAASGAGYLPATLSSDFAQLCGTGDQISFDPRSTSPYAGRGSVTPRLPAATFGAHVLQVQLQDPHALCAGACSGRVAAAAVRAVATWLPAVRRTSPQGWQLVDVGGHLYLDESVVTRTLNVAAGRPGDDTESFLTGVGGQGWPGMFTLMSSDTQARKQICSASSLASEMKPRLRPTDGIPIHPSVWHYLCDSAPPACSASTGCMTVKLGFKETLPDDAIGLGFPDDSVQLNMGAYRYRDGTFTLAWTKNAAPAAADQRRILPLFPVLLHEVGHWLGVAHMGRLPGDEPGRYNAMYSVMSEADDTCLTQANLAAAMTAINEQTSPQRLVAREALLYGPRSAP